jgi:hypothetical protein
MIISDLMKMDCRTGLYVLHELTLTWIVIVAMPILVVITRVFQTQNASCF